MPAELLLRDKRVLASGAIREIVIWKLPRPEKERPHGYKYRLYYGKAGKRLIGYDNERGKGDHRHCGGRQESYRFISPRQLIADFLDDVRHAEEQV